MLTRRDAAVAQHVRVRDERRHRRVQGRLQLGDGTPVGRVKLLGVAQADVVNRGHVPGQAVISCRVVVLDPVVYRTNLGEAIDDRREPRQMFGDPEPRLTGRNRLELASNPVRGIRLHVEGVEMRRPAELVQKDDVLGTSQLARMPARPATARGAARRSPQNQPEAGAGVKGRRPT